MFHSARMRLTAWYVAFLALVLIVFDVAVGSLLGHNLTVRMQDDLKTKALQAESALHQIGGGTFFERSRLYGDPSWSDVALFASTANGSSLQSTSPAVATVLPAKTAMESALGGRADFSTVDTTAGRFMVYTQPVFARTLPGLPSSVIAVIQVARSTQSVVDAVGRVVELLVIGTLVALIGAFFGGMWLAGKALKPISDSVARQKQFIADASHELRTPVTVIRTAAESIIRQKEAPAPRVLSLAEDIVAETGQLGRLVGELSELSDADARLAALTKAPVDVRSLMSDVVASGRLLGEAAGVEVEDETSAAGGTIQGDGARLRQLFSILLDNAVKFSAKGGVVVLRASSDAGKLSAEVVDHGQGIADADLPRIFERFFRGAAERSRAGRGLGLSIARSIADQHKGAITVVSNPGAGSTFTVTLPLSETAAG